MTALKRPGSLLHSVAEFYLSDPEIYQQVRADYEFVRETIIRDGFSALSGSMGVFVQPRPLDSTAYRGPGHGSVSRAFYARAPFVARILGDGYHIPLPVVTK